MSMAGEDTNMADAVPEAYDLKIIPGRTVHDEDSDKESSDEVISEVSPTKEGLSHHDQESENDTARTSISQASSSEGDASSDRLEQRRTTCHYFDNFPQIVLEEQVLENDYFYQEHLKSCHFSSCEPLAAPHDDTLPDEPPLCAEAPIFSVTPYLRPVKLRDRLLSPRHIRLVKLLSPGHSNKCQRYNLRPQARDLRCEVYQASLDDVSSDGQPLFAALSYVCGSPTLTQRVWCGGEYIPTTHNLFEALLHVRDEDHPRLLWADGLCINQEDTDERNHQVGLLHRIYSQAHVIAWLGTGYGKDFTALANYLSFTAQLWTSVVRSEEAASLGGHSRILIAIAKHEECRQASKHPHRSLLPNMDRITNAAYFTRVWVAQEMFLGKTVVCQLGRQVFSVAVLTASLQYWSHRHGSSTSVEDVTFRYLEPSLSGNWEPLQMLTRAQDLSIVEGFGRRQCFDPRDHIYGLSALFEQSTAYPIDYSLSIAEVFCDFTVHCLETLSDWSVFDSYRTIMHSKFELPSWLLNWTRKDLEVARTIGLPSWCPYWARGDLEVGRNMLGTESRWHASGDSMISLERPAPFMITLKGHVISKVTWCSINAVVYQQSSAGLITEAVEYLCSCPQYSPLPTRPQGLDLTRLISWVLRCLTWIPDKDSWVTGEELHDELQDLTQTLIVESELEDSMQKLLGPVYLATAVPELCSLANFRISARIPLENFEAIVDMMETRISSASDGCRMFLTDDGMLGTGLPGMLAGDVLCVLFGSDVPYILRPTEAEGQYLLIGECYVRELMKGEAMEMDLQEQKLTLV